MPLKNKVRERTSAPRYLNLKGSETDFARRRTAAQLPSFVRRVHPPEGFVSQEIDEISCETKKGTSTFVEAPGIINLLRMEELQDVLHVLPQV